MALTKGNGKKLQALFGPSGHPFSRPHAAETKEFAVYPGLVPPEAMLN
jgi:hypothetical protein